MTETAPAFSSWAKLELMGHRTRVGFVQEVEMFGGKLLRIDIPATGGDITEFYGCSSVYALSPVSEEIARDWMKRHTDPRPVRPMEYRLEAPQGADDSDDEGDRYE